MLKFTLTSQLSSTWCVGQPFPKLEVSNITECEADDSELKIIRSKVIMDWTPGIRKLPRVIWSSTSAQEIYNQLSKLYTGSFNRDTVVPSVKLSRYQVEIDPGAADGW